MNDILSLTPAQLNQAADLKEEIIKLEKELSSLLGSSPVLPGKRKPGRPKKEIAATVDKPRTKRRKMSAAARARMAAAAKARWAKAKAAGKHSL